MVEGGTGESVSGATLLDEEIEKKKREEAGKMKAEIDAKRKAVESKLNREGQLTPEEEAIVSAVHGVFEMYDKDKNGALTDGEYQPFFINWNQLVVGMEADLANDEAIIDETV